MNQFGDYYKDDSYILYDIKEFLYPFYSVECLCAFSQKQEISVVEEAFLSAIEKGIKEIEKLEKFLQLEESIFKEIYSDLFLKNYFKHEPYLSLSPLGKSFLKERYQLEKVHEKVRVNLDAISAEAFIEPMGEKLDRKKKNFLIPKIPYPRKESLSEYIELQHKSLQTILFECIEKDDNERTLIEILALGDKPTKFFKQYVILFYKNRNQSRKLLVLKDDSPSDELTNLINEKADELLDFSNEKEKEENLKLQNTPPLEDFKDLSVYKTGYTLSTYEHPMFFDFLLEKSERQIIIVSPWIRYEVLEKRLGQFENALKNGVKIMIFYGMGNNKNNKKPDIDEESKQALEVLKNQYPNLKTYKNDTPNHSKIIISDREWMIIGSFNWLSFEGSEDRDKRIEKSTFNKNEEAIKKEVNELLSSRE